MVPQHIDRYEIRAELGRGGMATVYRAYDPGFKREVAIKLLPHEFLHDSTFRARFEREAQAIARLEHPAIVPVYDVGEEDGQPYLVMAFMSGGSLADRIKHEPLPLEEAAAIVARLASALDEAHAEGIIHRDLKPANVLFDQYGHCFLSDFGIARLVEAATQLTGNGFVGTPAYMAPEMTSSEGLSPLVDVYALGITLFQMLTGQLPYQADDPVAMLQAHRAETIPDIAVLRPDLPAGVQRIIARAIAKAPADRYQSAGELAADLQAVAGGQPVAAGRPLPRLRGPRLAVLIGTALGVIVVVLAALWVAGVVSGSQVVALLVGTPTKTPTATATSTQTLKATATATVTPSATPMPTRTPTLTPSLTPTPSPTPIPLSKDNLRKATRLFNLTLGGGYGGSAIPVAWSPDSKRSAVGLGGTLAVWDLQLGQPVWQSGWGTVVAWSPVAFPSDLSAPPIALSGGALVTLLDAETGEPLRTLTGHTSEVRALAFGPDGKTLTGAGTDGRAIVWDVATGEVLQTQNEAFDAIKHEMTQDGRPKEEYSAMVLNSTGTLLAVAMSSNETVGIGRLPFAFVLDIATGEIHMLNGPMYGYMRALAFSWDGTVLASAEGRMIALWDVATGLVIRSVTYPIDISGQVTGVAFNPEGRILASMANNDTIVLWDTANSQNLRYIEGYEMHDPMDPGDLRFGLYNRSSIVWSPDGAMLAVEMPDGSVTIWGLAP